MKIPLVALKFYARIRDSKMTAMLLNMNIDWIFVLLLMLLVPIESWLYRVLIAIGATYVYHLVMADIRKLKRMN